jgi:hypothetical protein
MHVLHSCDVRHCVRPDHLFLGTNADNMADRDTKGRQVPYRKLSVASVGEIRAALMSGQTIKGIAAHFGVDSKTIRLIRDGSTWKAVVPID